MERLEAKQIKGHTYSLGFHTRALRRSQDSGNSVVNSVCRDSADGLCQFGVSPLCRFAALGMMKIERPFGSLWLEAGVG
jgi:hypothetical protein